MPALQDPVLDLIEQYHTAEKDYNDCPESDQPKLDVLRDKHTGAMDAITNSAVTASSHAGALQAIRAALNEEKLMSSHRTLTIALLEMGLAYFDSPQGVENHSVNNVDNGGN